MHEAVGEDRHAREGPHGWLLGRFVCPASRLAELEQEGGWAVAPPLSVVLDPAELAEEEQWLDAVREGARLAAGAAAAGAPVESLELLLPMERPASSLLLDALRAIRAESAAVPYLELRLGAGWRDSVPAAAGAASALGGRVKVRCGGGAAGQGQAADELALIVVACRDAGAGFKATDALDGGPRDSDPGSGPVVQGLLTLLAATTFAHAHRLRASEVEPLLAEEDPAAFALSGDAFEGCGYTADAAQITAVRAQLFAAWGSEAPREQVAALEALALLDGA